jgi:hypothetical protein
VPGGDAIGPAQRLEIERAVANASAQSGTRFTVYVGALPGGRAEAEQLHARTGADRDDVVLVAVDPGARSLEIVTGSRASTAVDDHACALGALTMTSAFANGDLVGGIRNGVLQLAEHARQPRTLHQDQP